MEQPNRLLTSLIWPLALLVGTLAQGAPFDERIKAPKAATPQELKTRLQSHFKLVERKQEEVQPGAFIRDRAAHRQWADLYYSITLAMDEAVPLTDLADFGLIENPDGSYRVDLQKYPQWEPLDSRLHLLTNPEVFESCVPALKARGFRDADLDALRGYVATYDPQLDEISEGRPLLDTFAKRLKSRQAAKRALDLNEVMAYRYQKASLKQEVNRQWAVGLLDAFDNQRQYILVSFFEEELASTLAFGVPSEPFVKTLESEAQLLTSGAYVLQLALAESDLQKEKARRAEKLMEGQQL